MASSAAKAFRCLLQQQSLRSSAQRVNGCRPLSSTSMSSEWLPYSLSTTTASRPVPINRPTTPYKKSLFDEQMESFVSDAEELVQKPKEASAPKRMSSWLSSTSISQEWLPYSATTPASRPVPTNRPTTPSGADVLFDEQMESSVSGAEELVQKPLLHVPNVQQQHASPIR